MILRNAIHNLLSVPGRQRRALKRPGGQRSRRRFRQHSRGTSAGGEGLEARLLLASVMDNGGTLQIDLEANERVSIVSNGNSYALTSSSQNFTDSGVTDATDFVGFGTTALTLNDLAAYTAVSITDSAAEASIRFEDSGPNAYQHDFDVNLSGNIAGNQAVGFLGASHFGNFNLTITTDRSIHLFDGSSLTTVDGNVNFNATNIGDASGAVRGIALINASIISSGDGNISLTGIATSAGPADNFRIGISLQNESSITSTSTSATAGKITLNGTGGAGDAWNFGVVLEDSATLSSVMGDISIVGAGGNGTGGNNYGVLINDAPNLQSTGTGPDAAKISIVGTGGAGTDWNVGLAFSSGSSIQTVDGDVVMTGHGGQGSGDSNRGINMNEFGMIDSTGTGEHAAMISVTGFGGMGGGSHTGVFINGLTSQINSQDGTILLSGTGGTGDGILNGGVWLSTSVHSLGTAPIQVIGLGGHGTNTSKGVVVSGGTAEISSAFGGITIDGTGGTGDGGFNRGVQIINGATIQSTATGPNAGDILVTGTGGIGSNWNVGATIGADTLRTVDGDIVFVGSGGAATGSQNHGIQMEDFRLIESTGTGQNAGKITFSGTSGTGAENNGGLVILGSLPQFRTIDGAIFLSGTGSAAATEFANGGLWLAASVFSLGTGSIDIVGSANSGTAASNSLSGVSIVGTGILIDSATGPITITGTGASNPGNFHHGVYLSEEVLVASTAGDVAITGTAGSGADSRGVWLLGNATSGAQVLALGPADIQISAKNSGTVDALLLQEANVLGGSSATGNIRIFADSIELNAASVIQSTGTLQIAPRQTGLAMQSISLGGANVGGQLDLNLTDAELATLQPGFDSITIGTPGLTDNGPVVALDTATFHDPVSLFAGMFLDATGTDITAPSVRLSGLIAPGQSPGILQVNGDLWLEDNSSLVIEAAGRMPGEGSGFHDQVNATGRVNIGANVELQTRWIPTWQANANDSLVIIERAGGTGKFAGLPEGTTLPEFFNAVISYVGGDGDDIVLTLPASMPKDVDGNGGFDANDSFLIHLTQLSGTDAQIDQSKGSSTLTAAQIRENVSQLSTAGDVDGDGDFDANDSFLIHLVKLAGDDSQIDQSKGGSPLSAAEIRTRIAALEVSAGSRAASRKIRSAQPLAVQSDATDLSKPTFFVADNSHQFSLFRLLNQDMPVNHAIVATVESPAIEDAAWSGFRTWLDVLE